MILKFGKKFQLNVVSRLGQSKFCNQEFDMWLAVKADTNPPNLPLLEEL